MVKTLIYLCTENNNNNNKDSGNDHKDNNNDVDVNHAFEYYRIKQFQKGK